MIWQKTLCDQILGRESREENWYPKELNEIIEEMLNSLPYKGKGSLPAREIMIMTADGIGFKKIAETIGSNSQTVKKNFERSLEFAKRYYAKLLELGVDGFKTYVRTMNRKIDEAKKYPGVSVAFSQNICDMKRTYMVSDLCQPTFAEYLLRAVTCDCYIDPPKYLEQNTEIALDDLDAKIVEVLRLRYGADGKRMTLDETAKKLALTRERVRNIEVRALRTLRHPARLRILECETVWSEEILKREQAEAEAKKAAAIKMAENPSGIALKDLNLSTRTFNCLHRAKYETIGAVYNAGPEKIRQLRNFGYTSLCEVAAILREIGLVKANDAWDIYP